MRWYFYHRQEIGYVYGSTKSYKVFLLGAMFSQKFHDFVVSSVSSNLQCGLAVSALRRYDGVNLPSGSVLLPTLPLVIAHSSPHQHSHPADV